MKQKKLGDEKKRKWKTKTKQKMTSQCDRVRSRFSLFSIVRCHGVAANIVRLAREKKESGMLKNKTKENE